MYIIKCDTETKDSCVCIEIFELHVLSNRLPAEDHGGGSLILVGK